jgi:hypothetical protein
MTAGEQVGYLSLAILGLSIVAGLFLVRWFDAWEQIGKGPLAIEQELPSVPRYLAPPATRLDRVEQELEVRQMLQAKSERCESRGEGPLDVEAEVARLLAPPDHKPPAPDEKLRDEVRQLIAVRNERRLRRGQQPLEIEAETDRQLADLLRSS